MPKVYVMTFFLNLPLHGWCCDRGYNYIDDESWRKVKMEDIIEKSTKAYYAAPEWAEVLIAKGHQYLTLWTNYYE